MSSFVKRPEPPPQQIASEPRKTAPIEQTLVVGLEHRPFTDEEIKEAFATFDLDHNRFVGAAEIAHILKLIGEEVTDEEIDEMIRMCDSDGDGQVTFDEFYKMMTTPPPPAPPAARKKPIKAGNVAHAKRYMRNFTGEGPEKAIDVVRADVTDEARKQQAGNRSTSIEAIIKRLSGGMGKIKPAQIKKIYKRFQDIDVDKSGAIEYEEFLQAMEMEDNAITKQMFKVFDMDGSGTIELKEFIVVLSRYTTAARTEKLKFAFMMFDEDGSGLIERAELVNMLRASFIVEGFSPEELEDRADRIFDFLTLPRDSAITYEDFLRLATTRNGLIFPLEEEKHSLGQDNSINNRLNS